MNQRNYKVRYLVEPWNRPPENLSDRRPMPGVVVSANNYGYTDTILVVSILRDKQGTPTSVLMLDSDSGGRPNRELLELVRQHIDHYLSNHV